MQNQSKKNRKTIPAKCSQEHQCLGQVVPGKINNYGCHQSKNPIRSRLHNEIHNLNNDIIKRIKKVDEYLSLLNRNIYDTNAQNDRDKYYLKHVRVIRCGIDDVYRNDIYKKLQRALLPKFLSCFVSPLKVFAIALH